MVLIVVVGYSSNLVQLRDSEEKNKERDLARRIWKTQKSEVSTQLEETPYLYSICQFLKLPDHIKYDSGAQESDAGLIGVYSVLRSSKFVLPEQICVACRCLGDDALEKYFNTELTQHRQILSNQGQIEALPFSDLGNSFWCKLASILSRSHFGHSNGHCSVL